MIRALSLALSLSCPAAAESPAWGGGYGGLSIGTEGPTAEVFFGAMADRGRAVLGVEIGAGLGDDDVALTGRLGRGVGGTLVYGLAGVGSDAEGEAMVLGAGASRRIGDVRLGGELRHELGEDEVSGETRLGGRVALEF